MSVPKSNYWLDILAEKVMTEHPEGALVVESGHAPSGYYHIGTLREILTASAIAWRLDQAGRTVRHIDFVDDIDAFRKVPAGVPEEWNRYIGMPLNLVPDPTGKHASWAEWLTDGLYRALGQLGLNAEIRYAHNEYPNGVFTKYIEAALSKMDEDRHIISTMSKRELPDNWSPVQILSDHNSWREWEFAGWDKARQVVMWRDQQGDSGEVSYTAGRVKLDWRFDWPARWDALGVDVEPFGRDHASRGGSYDTGEAIIRQIFGGKAPTPVPYDFINRTGDTKKMSKSAGNVLTIEAALEVMPPEIMRFFIIKSLPSRQLFFDEGLGLVNLIDEFAKTQAAVKAGEATEFAEAYDVAAGQTKTQTISEVPFGHLVQCYQAARRDEDATLELLERSGFGEVVQRDGEVIRRELTYVRNWLVHYAPDSVKFEVQETVPEVELSSEQRAFLLKLSSIMQDETGLSGQAIHDAIYAAAEVAGLKPAGAFTALYRVILGQDRGPKAGWFLASLDRDWVVERLRAGAASPEGEASLMQELAVTLPDGRQFRIDHSVAQAFPRMAIGYLVADIEPQNSTHDYLQRAQAALASRGVTKDDLGHVPELQAWREAYRQFGVKPSDYRSSVEALVRRTFADKPAQINSVVDLYNLVSVKHLLPAGAMDLDRVVGDISVRYGHDGEKASLLGIAEPVPVTARQVVYADESRIITWLWNYRDAKETAVTMDTRRAIFFMDSLTGVVAAQAAIADLMEELKTVAAGRILAFGVLPSPEGE